MRFFSGVNIAMIYSIFISQIFSVKRAYISVTNDLVTDQRVARVARLLAETGFKVCCIGRVIAGSMPVVSDFCRARRFWMLFRKGPLFYACYNVRLFFTLLLVSRPSLFIAIDLDTLPACYLASRIRRAKLIFDSHEFFTQVPELVHRKTVQSIWKWIEGTIVPRISFAVTVSYPIAEIYRRLYGTRFRVVRNTPPFRKAPERRVKEEGEKRIIIYQGALNVGRGLELMINTMELLEDTVFLIVGTGDIERELRDLVRKKGLEEKVVFKGRVPPDELLALTSGADLGISLEEDLGLSYRYSLPNKIFDYIQSRIPVLCSNLPEMARIVETYGIGVAARYREPERLAGNIRYMLEERKAGAWRDALEKAAGELNWEKESKEFLKVLGDCGVLVPQVRKE
jgi:glycosyltransferase involved in cell wall biosynthesis